MKVKILAEDIMQGSYWENKDCPIARALKRAGFSNVSVGGHYANAGDVVFDINEANLKVIRMFNTKDKSNSEFTKCIPIEDFEIELEQIN